MTSQVEDFYHSLATEAGVDQQSPDIVSERPPYHVNNMCGATLSNLRLQAHNGLNFRLLRLKS